MKTILSYLTLPIRHLILIIIITGIYVCNNTKEDEKYILEGYVSSLEIKNEITADDKKTFYNFEYVDTLGTTFHETRETYYGENNYAIRGLKDGKVYKKKEIYQTGTWVVFIFIVLLIKLFPFISIMCDEEDDYLYMLMCFFILSDNYTDIMFGEYDWDNLWKYKILKFFGYNQ